MSDSLPGITAAERNFLRTTINKHLGSYSAELFVFGSRVRGNFSASSDLDLLIQTEVPVSLATLAFLKEELEQSDLPFRVDIVQTTKISPDFYHSIKNDLVRL